MRVTHAISLGKCCLSAASNLTPNEFREFIDEVLCDIETSMQDDFDDLILIHNAHAEVSMQARGITNLREIGQP